MKIKPHIARLLGVPKLTGMLPVSLGFTHVIILQASADFIRAHDLRTDEAVWQLLRETLNSLTLEKDITGVYALHRLAESHP